MHWNGTRWKVVAGFGDFTDLTAVAALSHGNAWAVGSRGLGGVAVIEHWNGTAWRTVTSPGHLKGESISALTSVIGLSPSDVWAAGSGSQSLHKRGRIEHWNGRVWTAMQLPQDPAAQLNGLGAASRSNIWAVGYREDARFNRFPFIDHWTGNGWRPVAAGSGVGTLNSVSADSASDAWAVGTSSIGATVSTRIEHWNGAKWLPSGRSILGAALTGVKVLSRSDVWAVGYHTSPEGRQPLVEHWNGKAWSLSRAPSWGVGDDFQGLARVGSNGFVAVGWYETPIGGQRTLVETRIGGRWSTPAAPTSRTTQFPIPGAQFLQSVDAVSPTNVRAAGFYDAVEGPRPLVDHWNGKVWQATPAPLPRGLVQYGNSDQYEDAELFGITVVATDDVWAVGSYASRSLVEHWNGRVWQMVPSPATGTVLRSVSAISARDIWAVGTKVMGTHMPFLIHWNGFQWREAAEPTSANVDLYAVLARSSRDVWTAGEYQPYPGSEQPAAPWTAHWNGRAGSSSAIQPRETPLVPCRSWPSAPPAGNSLPLDRPWGTLGVPSTTPLWRHTETVEIKPRAVQRREGNARDTRL